MSETEPMNRLDDSIKHFSATALDREGVVTGWVMMITSSRFDDDGNVLYAYDYSVGPDCDMMRAVGLVEVCRLKMQDDIVHPGGDDD